MLHFKLVAWTNRADVQRQDEDDEEAQVPGEQRAEQDHTLLLFKVSIPVQEEESQKKDDHNLDGQRRPTHSAPLPCAAKTPGKSGWWKEKTWRIKIQEML